VALGFHDEGPEPERADAVLDQPMVGPVDQATGEVPPAVGQLADLTVHGVES
jgi:hypothetical protein